MSLIADRVGRLTDTGDEPAQCDADLLRRDPWHFQLRAVTTVD
jgi:hypothetical protein